MLFNSPEFIYFFVPFSIAIWWVLQKIEREKDAQCLVIICSLFFYGWWDTRYVPLLIGNAFFNFYLGQLISMTKLKPLLILGLIYNIGVLGYFKYADFFILNWSIVSSSEYSQIQIILPLGISFFTFQVIAYLVDCYKGHVSDFNLRRFAFSISFYPHLIAGPILHYSDVMPQLKQHIDFNSKQFSQGLLLFVFGLFKKSVISDRIAEIVDPLFSTHSTLQFFESWVSAIGYGLQVYFDFSGYSDMAIGIGLMFGIFLPQNFNSPYQANSITDFWKRWHISLSRFLRNYVYIPLGGNQNGFTKGLLAAVVTMIIGGFWHGAAWTFVLWGLLHGLFIGIHRIFVINKFSMPESLAIAITFLSVTSAWVVFRADSVAHAISIWEGMLGINGFAVPSMISGLCHSCVQTSLITGMEFIQGGILLTLCIGFPNANEIVQNFKPSFPNLAFFAALFFTSIWMSGNHESFIYWQF
jgi:D-alanyl-lipoteichoic acid acyltransferase DltB (MBOAT superfamily)